MCFAILLLCREKLFGGENLRLKKLEKIKTCVIARKQNGNATNKQQKAPLKTLAKLLGQSMISMCPSYRNDI